MENDSLLNKFFKGPIKPIDNLEMYCNYHGLYYTKVLDCVKVSRNKEEYEKGNRVIISKQRKDGVLIQMANTNVCEMLSQINTMNQLVSILDNYFKVEMVKYFSGEGLGQK